MHLRTQRRVEVEEAEVGVVETVIEREIVIV